MNANSRAAPVDLLPYRSWQAGGTLFSWWRELAEVRACVPPDTKMWNDTCTEDDSIDADAKWAAIIDAIAELTGHRFPKEGVVSYTANTRSKGGISAERYRNPGVTRRGRIYCAGDIF